MLSAPRDQRQVFIADVLIVLELLEGLFVGRDVLELSDFPELKTDDFPKGKIQEIDQKRICVDDLACFAIEDENSVLGRFEEPAKRSSEVRKARSLRSA
jgi:hypothetical protein